MELVPDPNPAKSTCQARILKDDFVKSVFLTSCRKRARPVRDTVYGPYGYGVLNLRGRKGRGERCLSEPRQTRR